MTRLLIFLVVVNIATWAGEYEAKSRTDDIILFFHPLPNYVAKSHEELGKQHDADRDHHDDLSINDSRRFGNYRLYEALLNIQEDKNRSSFWAENVGIYREAYEARIDMIFVGMKAIFAILLLGTLISWLKTSPFSRLAGFVGLTTFSNKTKLAMLEKELNDLRRQHALGLVSDDAFGRRTAELQEKANKLLI